MSMSRRLSFNTLKTADLMSVFIVEHFEVVDIDAPAAPYPGV